MRQEWHTACAVTAVLSVASAVRGAYSAASANSNTPNRVKKDITRTSDNIGTSVEIELRATGGVERSAGKAKRVVDERR